MKHTSVFSLALATGALLVPIGPGAVAHAAAPASSLGLSPAAVEAWAALASQEEGEALYHARVQGDGAIVRNLMDAKGLAVATLESGAIVAVYSEEPASGWLAVELPEGFAAYVFGRFLEPTQRAGVYRVSRNAVNIRPTPSDDVRSFPLPQRLHAGDEVRVIGQADPTKAMGEDWVRIWTPPGVRAYLRSEHVERLGEAEGQGAWARVLGSVEALRRAQLGDVAETTESAATVQPANAGGATESDTTEANAPDAGTAASEAGAGLDAADAVAPENALDPAAARSALARLRSRIDAEQAKRTPDLGTPDFRSLQAELQTLLGRTSDATVRAEVGRELERVAALADAAAMVQELERIKDQRDQATARQQRTLWEEGRRLDPLRSAFDVYGVLVRRIAGDGTPTYTIEVRREVVAEVLCTSGRYDLDAFSGFEIGVKGRPIVVEAGVRRGQEALAVPVLDAGRIAVLKRR